MKIEQIFSYEMPKGKYFIGDLSYILPNEIYNNYIDSSVSEDSVVRVTTESGKEFLSYFGLTFDSEGVFKDNQGKKYKISTGMIGIVQLYDQDMISNANRLMADGLAQIVEFDEEISVSSEAGIFYFGHIIVDTTVYEDEEENDDPWGGKKEDNLWERDERDDENWNWINT